MEFDLTAIQNSMMGGGKKNNQQSNGYKKNYNQNGYKPNGNNRPQYGSGGYQNHQSDSYVGAPYNFVSFSNDVYEYQPEQLVSHGELSAELFTGEIEYELTAKTPIMVDDGSSHFHKNEYGKYSIPGSTMRGLIRNNVQILGLSSMADDIDDYALMYRNVAKAKNPDKAKKEQEEHYDNILGAKQMPVGDKSISVLTNVKAGYIAKEGGKYVIYQTEIDSIKPEYKEMNYYILSEKTIVDNNLSGRKDYDFLVHNRSFILQNNPNVSFKMVPGKDGKTHYIGDENDGKNGKPCYKPYVIKISYELSGDRNVTAVGEPDRYSKEGYIISSGRMKEKKVLYIIPKIDYTKEKKEIPDKDVRAFQIDIEKKKNTLNTFGGRKHFDLPDKGEMKPVFYIFLDGSLYFGFTPRLRLFYDHTIKEGLNENHKEGMLDYAKALFGYSNKNSGYKSRVSFSDAVLEEPKKEQQEVRLILGEPKPTSYSDYVKPDEKGTAMTYNQNGFQLRGVKQYWLHKQVVPAPEVKNMKVASAMHPLPTESVFVGKVRFKNLTADELGLLLWSIRLKDESWVNIGKAKAYGYGNAQLKIKAVRRVNMELAYKNGDALCLNPMEQVPVEELIQCYKDTVNQRLNGRNIEQLPHIREFFTMKNSSIMPDEHRIRYMSLDKDKKEYQSRRDKVLPKIEDLVKNK